MPSTRVGIAVCLVALLALAAPGAAGPETIADTATTDTTASSHAVQPQPAGDLALPERVVLPGQSSHGTAVVGTETEAALDRDGARLEGAYERHLLEERYGSAESDAARRSILQDAVDQLDRDVGALRAREREARNAYRNGELSERAFLVELVSINEHALELETTADLIAPVADEGLAAEVSATDVTARIRALRGSLLARHGPVRSQVSDAMAGNGGPQRIYLSVSANGTALSTIEDGTYHREANRDDLLVDGSEEGLSLNEAYDLAIEELYPEYRSNYEFSNFGRGSNGVIGQVYQVLGEGDASYEHGTLRSYIDAVSENVFWEYQRMELTDDLPTSPSLQNTTRNLTLSVRSTYPSGPANVTVVEDGTPVSDVSVSVDGDVVTETDEDGRAWVVLPDESPEVSVTVDGATARTPVEWELANTTASG